MTAYITTEIINANPRRIAVSLNRFLSMTKSPRFSEYDARSSDVKRRMNAVTAIHRLMSQKDSGNFILLYLQILIRDSYVLRTLSSAVSICAKPGIYVFEISLSCS